MERRAIEEEINKLQVEKLRIESRIISLQSQLNQNGQQKQLDDKNLSGWKTTSSPPYGDHGLSKELIYRYSRHLLLPDFGIQGQANLLNSSILVVGAGGLGSPVALYLAACGVGRLGIVDNDIVELNNLQRQIIHTEAFIGKHKVESAAAACRAINSTIDVIEHKGALLAVNALDIISKYDVVVDATDNIPTRYMINDGCVLLNKPLVSGAALGLEGQLTIYHYNGGPCYRCLFPTPPPTSACQRCSDSGVLGVVPGIIGCLQALEAIKLASSVGVSLSGRMLLFDALSARIRTVKIRERSLNCDACGENPIFTKKLFRSFDYENFTETPIFDLSCENLMLLSKEARGSSNEYEELLNNGKPHVLLDVRPAHHFQIASLPNSINIPLPNIEKELFTIDSALKEIGQCKETDSLYVICRRGNDSQIAVQILHQNGYSTAKDLIGGLISWANLVNCDFPIY
ncbi:Adenylyltransferase and sulfurtransferase MOCS3-1 [Zostera marina]|uniref:Adenylyltransferase and sulfurtransferase MOCS3 n=1 Tax=Zostera marina TaxID=29655 RepID=A0A0K9PEX5_ZOSMR|nr:Adenylyltransferase and sulfurtransferase MOCS3-1 [Zostera marina]